MSSYTMKLREYIESWSQENEFLPLSEKIEIGRPKLFDFSYPIFDINYKKVLETHIIRHFYMREIGFETEGLFKFQLETWMIVNMPYFNKLFESELIQFDPLKNAQMEVTHTKENDTNKNNTTNMSGTSTSTGKVTEDNFNRQLESNNPDSRLTITSNDGEGVIEYASQIDESNQNNVSDSTGTSTGTSNETGNSTINETEDFIQTRVGKIGVQSYSKMLNEYRDSFIRIENMMFKEMQELFMLVY